MDAYRTVNDILVNLFHEIWKLEEKALITEEYRDLSVNDMHVIEAVGLKGGKNMSKIAKMLDITVGSLTTAMNGLVKKGYVDRERSEEDRRVVTIQLTQKGKEAYKHHARFHEMMANAALKSLSDQEIPVITKTLANLAEFFRGYDQP
ncbi:MAG: MarR family transcriptional regulator [Candidatus Gastranaerophilales bacterium]|nr:MarR family transcriptional regulator [Candidatus Gastranaerophilales bacterium]